LSDPENGNDLIHYKRLLKGFSSRAQLLEGSEINEEVREWLQHLFGSDYDKVAQRNEPEHYWRHILQLSGQDIAEELEFLKDYKSADHSGPHTSVETRQDLTIIRIKENSYKKLHEITRDKLKTALEIT